MQKSENENGDVEFFSQPPSTEVYSSMATSRNLTSQQRFPIIVESTIVSSTVHEVSAIADLWNKGKRCFSKASSAVSRSSASSRKISYAKPILYIIVGCWLCVFVGFAVLLSTPLSPFRATAMITILPLQEKMSIDTLLDITSGKTDPKGPTLHQQETLTMSLTQGEEFPVSGTQFVLGSRARGFVTFHNAARHQKLVHAGTVVTSKNGIQFVIEQDAIIPSALPTLDGWSTVPAHAVLPGVSGNITSGSLASCCHLFVTASIFAPFTGGRDARTHTFVSSRDLETRYSLLYSKLMQSVQPAFLAQVTGDETLLPAHCSQDNTSDASVGGEAQVVHVRVSLTCTAIAVRTSALKSVVYSRVRQAILHQLGKGYRLVGDVEIQLLTMNERGEQAVLGVHALATYQFLFSSAQKRSLRALIVSLPKNLAVKRLRQIPHVGHVDIQVLGIYTTYLPTDQNRITILVKQ